MVKIECRNGFSGAPRHYFPVKYGYRVEETRLPGPGVAKRGVRFGQLDRSQDHRRRPVRASLGCHVVGASYPQACPNGVANVISGITKRVGGDIPTPDPELFAAFRDFVAEWLNENIAPLESCTDTSFETWLAATHYTEKRKMDLARTYADFVISGGDIYASRNTKVKCFLKDECHEDFKYPRGIYSRADAFKVRVGPIFKCIERVLYKSKYFIKHVPVSERASYIKERFGDISGYCPSGAFAPPPSTIRPSQADDGRKVWEVREGQERKKVGGGVPKWYILSSDYSGYEKHFTRQIFEACEFQLYEFMTKFLPNGGEFMKMLRVVVAGTNHCVFKYVRADIPAGRMSGEMNTSLGNGFTNLMIFLFLNKVLGNKHVDCLIEGDDCLGVFLGQRISEEMFSQVGFTMKQVVYLPSCNLASFCGQVFDFESCTVITNPVKVLLNFAWVSAQYSNSSYKTRLRLAKGKALSLIAQYPGCPVIQEFSLYILRVTSGVSLKIDGSMSGWERDNFLTAIRSSTEPRVVSIHSREIMASVFKLSIDQQIALENHFNSKQTYEPIMHAVLYDFVSPSQFEYDQNYVMLDGGDSVLNQWYSTEYVRLKGLHK